MTLLNELALAAGSVSDVDHLLDLIVQKSVKAVRAEQGSMMLLNIEDKKPSLKTLVRKEDFSTTTTGYRVGTQITGWVIKNRKPLLVNDLASDTRFSVTPEEGERLRTILCVPIMTRGTLIGVLIMTNKKTGEPFREEDERLLSILSAQSGQLIHNSQLQNEAAEMKAIEHELELARQMQLNLLPPEFPETDSIQISHLFKSYRAIGGDYYDFLLFDDKRLGIVIADVSGHGPSAALIMSMVKGVFHASAKKNREIDTTLEEINRVISEIVPDDVFITMMFLLFDSGESRLYYTNAGHTPLVYYNSDSRRAQPLISKGCALNVMAVARYETKSVDFRKGDVFLIYTDGITEAVNSDREMFSVERLAAALSESGQSSPGEIIGDMEKKLHNFTGRTEWDDDIVLLAAKIK